MKQLRVAAAMALSCIFTITAQADLQIVTREKSGHISTFSTNGKLARIDDSQQPGFILIHQSNNRVSMVDPQSREVMEMGGIDSKTTNMKIPAVNLNIKLEKKNKGPKIAGYETRQYDVQVNGRHCGTVYGSIKAMNEKGVDKIFQAMSTMQQQSQSMSRGFGALASGNLSECEQADLQMHQHFKTSGLPMRILDQNGNLESEIIKFNSKAKVPADYYLIPADYRVTNMQEKMNQAQQQMQKSMPDMNQLMQQMQQNNQGLPPEAMEQMKKMQEMFKQQFQQ